VATNGAQVLTPAQKSALAGPMLSSPFDIGQRLYASWDQGKVFDYNLGQARELKTMLSADGGARKVEQVLTLPIRAAAWEIRPAPGDSGETAYVRAQLDDKLGRVIDQMTTAVAFRKAFFELQWDVADDGTVKLADIAWRPPASCEAAYDPKTGQPLGFRQRVSNPGGLITVTQGTTASPTPGYVVVPEGRAFVYVHGSYREPIEGLSDLDVAFWAWTTKQKILFLWFQFLEGQSLPKTIAYGDDQRQADDNADALAEAKASAVIGMQRPNDPGARTYDVIESSGQGAAQFLQAINYLDGQMSAAVLAGFTDLTALASHTRSQGSYALSADQSEFFLAARQAVADEMAESISRDLFKRMCDYQFPDAKPPTLEIGPLSKHDKERSLQLLNSLLTAQHFNAPPGIVDLLITSTAGYVGLPVDKVAQLVKEHPTKDPAEAAAGAPAAPADLPPEAAQLGSAVDVAANLVQQHNAAA
jgi:hypothetical protein